MQNTQNPIIATLSALAGKVFGEDKQQAGPDDVGPTTNGPELVTLPFDEELMSRMFKEVEASDQRVKARQEKWDTLLEAYLPTVAKSGAAETVKSTKHFRNLHSKIGQLFYSTPDIVCTAKEPSQVTQTMPPPPPMPGQPLTQPPSMEDIIPLKQAVLMDKLGPNEIDATRLIDELLFDSMGWSGIACSKIGYRVVMNSTQQPVMGPPPTPQVPGSVLGLSQPQPTLPQAPVPQMGPDGQPQMETVQVPIFEEYYWRRFSPKKIIMNADLHSTRYDADATLMGMHFFMAPKLAARAFNLSEDEVGKAVEDTMLYQHQGDKSNSGKPGLVHGMELFIKAYHYVDDQPHPLAIYQMVLIEGIKDKPVIWRPSPDQTFDQSGKLTQDSMVGFPIRVLAIRDLADSPFPDADAAFTNSLIKQVTTFRRQGVQMRDAAIGKYLYDQDAFDETEVKKLEEGGVGDMIGVKAGILGQKGSKGVLDTTAQVHAGPSDAYTEASLNQEIDETLGISPNQAGSETNTVRTATEVSTIANAIIGRNTKELSRVESFYLSGVRMLDQLLMRYADEDDYVSILGDAGEQVLKLWNNKIISGRYLYSIAPDSQHRVDNAVSFTEMLQYYNLTAKDVLSNRPYILKKLAAMRGMDPNKAVIIPQPTPPKPDMPAISLALKVEDLRDPAVIALFAQAGIHLPILPPPAAAIPGGALVPNPGGGGSLPPHLVTPLGGAVLPPHGGPADRGDVISEHLLSNSGKRPSEPGAGNHRQQQVK